MRIACSLDATELTSRLDEIRALGREALLTVSEEGSRAELRFGPGAGIRDRVERIVAAESRCCPFLAMSIGAAPGTTVLTIDAPAGAEPVLHELVADFRR